MKNIKQTIKFGNSVGIVIPKFIVDDLQIESGTEVIIDYDEKEKVIKIIKK